MKEIAIEISDIDVYYGEVRALKNVSITINNGDYLAIMGPNGGGKSTFLKSILGLIPIYKGYIKIFGKKGRENLHLIGYVPQISDIDKDFPITLIEVILLGTQKTGLSWFHRYKKEEIEKAKEFIEMVGLNGMEKRRISQLSGGEFQKMLIARALITKPRILILDEPTTSVDVKSSRDIYDLLGKLNKDITILLVTHNVLAISPYVKDLACLNETLVYHGEPSLTEDIVNKMYGCPVELVAHGVPHRVLKDH